MIGEREWCPDCRTMSVVLDEDTDVTLESGYMSRRTVEVDHFWQALECGHTKSHPTGRFTAYRDPQ